MPITPLHFGLIPVADKLTKGKMSATSFILVNIFLDIWVVHAIVYNDYLDKYDRMHEQVRHGIHWSHDWLFVLFSIALIALPLFRKKGWALGAVIGGVSHVFLDALVHTDIRPFGSLADGNPLYTGLMNEISFVLLIGCVWWALLIVARARARLKKRSEST